MAEDLKKLVEKGISRGYSLEKIQSDFANAGWGEAYLNNIPVYYNEFKKKSPVGPKDAGVLPSRQVDTRFSSESQLQQDKYAGVGNIPLSDPLLKKKDGLADSLFKIINQSQKDADNANKYVPQIQKLWNDYSSIERGQKETQNIFDERGRINRLALSSLNASAKRNSDRVKEEAKAIAKDDGVLETAARGFYGGILGAADYVANLFDPDTYDDQPDAPDSLGLEAKRQLERAQKASLGRKLSAGYTEKQIEDGFIGNFANGNYGAAFDLFGRDLVEVLPQSAVGFIPYVGLPLMAASAGGGGWQAVKDDDKYSTLEKFLYAPLVGAAEYATEKFFGMDRRMVQKGLSEAFGKTIKSGADIPKKELGDMLFGGIPKAVRAPLEEGLEEGIVSTFTQTLDKIMAGKPFDPVEIAESVMLGAGAGGSTYALVRGGSALLQTPVFNDVYTITNNVNKINELLKSEDIVPEEKEILSNRLNQFKTQLNQLRNEASDYYKPFSQEDKQRTLELNQAITKGMKTYGAMKTPEAKAEVVNTIRQSLAEKAQIEQKYDSTQKQQVPSPVVQGAQPGGVPIQGTSAEAPQAGGVLQVPSQQEEEIASKTKVIENSSPAFSFKPVSVTLTENNAPEVIGNITTYVDTIPDELFKTLSTSRQEVMNGVESISNVISSLSKSGRQVPVTVYATEDAWKRGTGQPLSRGIYVESEVEGQPSSISVFLPALVGNTVYHEGLHDVVPKVFGTKGIETVAKRLSQAVEQDPLLAAQLGQFVSNYKQSDKAEEFLAELGSRVSAGDIDIEVTKSLATRFMEAVASVLGAVGIKMSPNASQLSRAFLEYAQKLGAGVELGEIPEIFDTEELNEMANGDIESEPFIETEIVAPTNVKRQDIVFPESGTYPVSKITKSDVKDIEAFLKEQVKLGKNFAFWYADQFGRGNYVDPYTGEEYFLDGGPSFPFDPENKKNGDVWATGYKTPMALYKEFVTGKKGKKRPDFIVQISGHPRRMMFFNKTVNKIWIERARAKYKDIDLLKKELTSISNIKSISFFVKNTTSWEQMLSDLDSNESVVIDGKTKTKSDVIKKAIGFVKEINPKPLGKKGEIATSTKLYNLLVENGLHPDNFDNLRDGFFKEYDFNEGEILCIYKATDIVPNANTHGTYAHSIKGEPVLVPDAKVSAWGLMPEEVRRKRKTKTDKETGEKILGKELQDLPKSAIQKAMAPDYPTVYSVTKDEKQLKKAITKLSRKLPKAQRITESSEKLEKLFRRDGIALTKEEAAEILTEVDSWRDWYDGISSLVEEVFGEYAADYMMFMFGSAMAANSASTIGGSINNLDRFYKEEALKGLPLVKQNIYRSMLGLEVNSRKIQQFINAGLGDKNAKPIDMHVWSFMNSFSKTKNPNEVQFKKGLDFVDDVAEVLGWDPREVQATMWAANILRLGGKPDTYEEYIRRKVDKGLNKTIQGWRNKGIKPVFKIVKDGERLKTEYAKEVDREALEGNLEDINQKIAQAIEERRLKAKQAKKETIITSLSERFKGDKLLDLQDTLDELLTSLADVDAEGNVTLYHRTTKENKSQIQKSGQMKGEEDGLFFSTTKDGQAEGYGEAVVKLKVPIEDIQIDDLFEAEAHVRIPTSKAGQIVDVSEYLEKAKPKKPKVKFQLPLLEEESSTTQVATTIGSYAKAANIAKRLGAKNILDYGAGLGLGSDAMRNVVSNVDSFEPFPERWKGKTPPTYTDNTDIEKKYDAVVSLNVLNVVRKDLRDAIVKDIFSLLNDNGAAIISTRAFKGDIAKAKNFENGPEDKSYIIKRKQDGKVIDVFQKGFDGNELVDYLQELLGDEAIVRKDNSYGAAGAIITKSPKVKRMALTDTFKGATAKALEGVDITTSNDDLFNKIKGSKWNTIPYTLEQIVKKWDELKNVKNDNIDTIKYLIDNPSKTPIVLNSKGDLIDGHHRVVANKISGISKVKYVFDDGSFDINEPFTGNINKNISEAYYKAKADGANPKLVQDIEDLLGQTAPKVKRQEAPTKKAMLQIIGENADLKEWTSKMLLKANEMERRGVKPKTIFNVTGWERGADKKWKYPVPTFKLDYTKVAEFNNGPVGSTVNLYDLVENKGRLNKTSSKYFYDIYEYDDKNKTRTKENEDVFDFYPKFANIKVTLGPTDGATFYKQPSTYPGDKTLGEITVSKKWYNKSPDHFFFVLVHEIQHAVQHMEGFAVGGSPSTIENELNDFIKANERILANKDKVIPALKNRIKDQKERIKWYIDQGYSQETILKDGVLSTLDGLETQVRMINDVEKQLEFLKKIKGATNLSNDEKYELLSGEVEANNAAKRATFELAKGAPTIEMLAETEQFGKEYQLILTPDIEQMSLPSFLTKMGYNPKVKLQKIAKAQGSQLEAQMYDYLLSISEKKSDKTYKLPFTLDEFISFMSPAFSRQRAIEIYKNVSKGITQGKIDDAYEASRKLLDAEKNKKMFTWDAARKFFLDRQATLKAAILKAGMKNSYNLLVNRAGSGARANYFFSKQEKAIYDGLSSKDIEALDKIIMLRRIAEIDRNFDARGESRPIHPSRLNFESAQLGLAEKRKELGSAKFNELNDRADKYFDAFKSLLDSMYDEGLVSEDLYNRLKNLDYQPRMFLEHVFDMDELSMRDINLSANQVKRIKDGSGDEIMFDSRFLLAVYSKSTFSRIARNKVNRAIAEATSVNGNEEWISKDPKKQFSEVTYFEDGVRKQFYIKSSLKGELDDVQRFGAIPPESQKYVGLLSGSYLLKLLATRANPLFVFRNIPRDYLHVLFFTNVYDNMNMPLAMYRLAGDAIKGVKGKIKDDQDYKDFIEYGGGMEYLSTEGKEGMMTNRSLLNRTIEKLGSAGELSEIAFRLGMYKRLVQESLKNFNGTPTEEQLAQIKVEAVTKSREMIDFAQGGVATKTLESAVPYINAAFQGFRVSSAYIKNNPKEFVIKLGQLAIGLAVIAMYNAVMGDDDMEDIPEDVKRKYFIIMTPFTEEKDGKTVRKYIKIAKTQQLIPFISSLDMSLEGNLIAPFMGREPRFNEDTIKQSWDAFLSYFPKDPTKPLDEALSSVPLFSALAAYKMNYDTYRKRIVSTDYQDKNVLPAYEDFSDKNVPYFYKAIGQAVVGGAGPKRLQVATEKFITTPYSSLITMGGYTLMDAIASNVYEVKGPGGYTPAEQEAISNKALKSAGINVEKIFIGTTDPDHKIYNKREQIERINLEASTERRGLKLQAKELGGKYFTAKEQGDAKGMNEALEAIKNARIEVRNKAVEEKNKQDYDYFNDALKTNMRFGPTFPQEYNDITFATDNEARAKIIAIRDMNMTQKELIDYLVDYKRKTGKSIDIRTIIREYDKFVTNEKK